MTTAHLNQLRAIAQRHELAVQQRDQGKEILKRAYNYLVHGHPGITYLNCGRSDFDHDGHCDACEHEIYCSDPDAIRLLREANDRLGISRQYWRREFVAMRLERNINQPPLPLPR